MLVDFVLYFGGRDRLIGWMHLIAKVEPRTGRMAAALQRDMELRDWLFLLQPILQNFRPFFCFLQTMSRAFVVPVEPWTPDQLNGFGIAGDKYRIEDMS